MFNMSGNEELTKTIESLTQSVKSIQDELLTLKRGATHSGLNPQSSSARNKAMGMTWPVITSLQGRNPEWRMRRTP